MPLYDTSALDLLDAEVRQSILTFEHNGISQAPSKFTEARTYRKGFVHTDWQTGSHNPLTARRLQSNKPYSSTS